MKWSYTPKLGKEKIMLGSSTPFDGDQTTNRHFDPCSEHSGTTEPATSHSTQKCLDLEFTEKEYYVTADGLQTIYSDLKFQPKEYTWQKKGIDCLIRLCYPYTNHFLQCQNQTWEVPDRYKAYVNGTKTFTDTSRDLVYKPGEYTVQQNRIYVCIPADALNYNHSLTSADDFLTLIGWTLSATAILLCTVLYILLPILKKQDSRAFLCHMASLFWMYMTMVVIFMKNGRDLPVDLCYILAVGNHYAFLCSFTWANVVTLQLWCRFRYGKMCPNASVKEDKMSFARQAVYGWGLPGSLMVVALVLEFGPKTVLKPDYAEICLLNSWIPKWVFMYGPITVMTLVNVTFFVLTVVNLNRSGKEVSMVNNKINRQLLLTYIKLLVVMGITWIFQVIQWSSATRAEYWIVTNFISSLQGVFVFMVYCCRRIVLKAVLNCRIFRCCNLNNGKKTTLDYNVSNTTTSSFVMEETNAHQESRAT